MPPQDTWNSTERGTARSKATEAASLYDTWNGVVEREYYPVQAHAKGGIGQVLATGAKAGKHLLTADGVAGGTKTCSTTVMGMSGRLSSFKPDESYFQYASRDWEALEKGGPVHSKPFVTTARPTRVHDWPSGGQYNKWSGLSSYENNMGVLQNHMEVLDEHETRRINNMYQDRWTKAERNRLHGNQTREMFYQRRLENDAKRLELHVPKTGTMRACTTLSQPFKVADQIEAENNPEFGLRKSRTSDNHHAGRVYPASSKAIYTLEKAELTNSREEKTKRTTIAEKQRIAAEMSELDEFADRLEVHMRNSKTKVTRPQAQ